MDRFTETTQTGYLQNIGNSFKGMFFGLLFIIGSIVLLWWNESNSVAQADALKEVQQKVVSLPEAKYDPSAEGKAVHVQGEVKPLTQLDDPLFGITADGLKLARHVEMYQWRENRHSESKDKLGGGTETVTTYEYVKEWSGMPQNSASFKHPSGHENPPMRYTSQHFSTDAKLGAFHLNKEMVSLIGQSQSYTLETFPETIADAKNYRTFLYIGTDVNKPQVGDMKITYTYTPSDIYTYIGKEEGKALVPYRTSNGREIALAYRGKVAAKKIFENELENNALFTWLWRGAGLLLMYIGFAMMMGPLATIAKVVPALGHLVGYGTGIIAAILTLIFGSFIIALAWLGARPILSLAVLGIGIGIAVMLGKLGKKRGEAAASGASSVSSHEPKSQKRTDATPPPRRSGTTPPPRR